jgi:hypothetical protein
VPLPLSHVNGYPWRGRFVKLHSSTTLQKPYIKVSGCSLAYFLSSTISMSLKSPKKVQGMFDLGHNTPNYPMILYVYYALDTYRIWLVSI